MAMGSPTKHQFTPKTLKTKSQASPRASFITKATSIPPLFPTFGNSATPTTMAKRTPGNPLPTDSALTSPMPVTTCTDSLWDPMAASTGPSATRASARLQKKVFISNTPTTEPYSGVIPTAPTLRSTPAASATCRKSPSINSAISSESTTTRTALARRNALSISSGTWTQVGAPTGNIAMAFTIPGWMKISASLIRKDNPPTSLRQSHFTTMGPPEWPSIPVPL